jgi:sec-independent protein translocase protein TatA
MDLPHPSLALFDIGSAPEMLLVFVVALMFFGGDKMPGFARGLGKASREFKKATGEVEREFKRVLDEAEQPAPTVRPKAPAVLPSSAAMAYDPRQDMPEGPPPEIPPSLPPGRLPPPETGPGAHHTDV